jgi:hypothetical protein
MRCWQSSGRLLARPLKPVARSRRNARTAVRLLLARLLHVRTPHLMGSASGRSGNCRALRHPPCPPRPSAGDDRAPARVDRGLSPRCQTPEPDRARGRARYRERAAPAARRIAAAAKDRARDRFVAHGAREDPPRRARVTRPRPFLVGWAAAARRTELAALVVSDLRFEVDGLRAADQARP